MKMTQKNIALYIVLTIVTCGIYGIYWFYCIADEMQNADDTTLPTTPIVTMLLYLVTCGIYGIYAFYKWGAAMPGIAANRGVSNIEDRSIVYLILSIVGLAIVNLALIQNDINQLAMNNGAGA